MTVVVEQQHQIADGPTTIGESSSKDLVYFVFGTNDESAAQLAAINEAPIIYRGMPRRGSSVKAIGLNSDGLIHEVAVNYALQANQATVSDPSSSVSGLEQFSTTQTFNLVGGTKHITTALETTSYALLRAATDIKKTIGIDLQSGQVRGIDVIAPVLDFTLTAEIRAEAVTSAYILDLFRLTGRVNQAAFKGYAAGEVLFKGARGQKNGPDKWTIGFEFAWSENETDLNIGGIAVPSKKGWQYLEVMYVDGSALETIGGKRIKVPDQVNVHTVFKDGDFSKLKIGVT